MISLGLEKASSDRESAAAEQFPSSALVTAKPSTQEEEDRDPSVLARPIDNANFNWPPCAC